MPKGVIKTPTQEKKWERAKDIAAEQGKAKRWPLIMHIFRQMGGMSKTDQDQRNHLIDKALKSEDKRMPFEVHEIAYSLLSSKGKKLSKAKQLDEMYAALSALRNELSEELIKAKKAKEEEESPYIKWSQHPEHTPEELARIAKLVDEGYHPREAAHLITPRRGGRGEALRFEDALNSYVRPSQLSPKMHAQVKKIAQQWLDNHEANLLQRAKPEINPVVYASAQMKAAHDAKTADYHKAYSDFLTSDELKGKDPMERRRAVQAWKDKWKQENPEYENSLSELSDMGSKLKEAEEARKKHLEEVKHHIVYGGPPVEPADIEDESEEPGAEDEVESTAPKSTRAASEHMGVGQSKEGGAPPVSIGQDPSMKFADAHRKYVESVLRPQVGQAKPKPAPEQPKPAPEQPKPQPAQAPKPQPAQTQTATPQPEKPKTIIRRVAKPDQQERMNHIDAARMSLQTKKD